MSLKPVLKLDWCSHEAAKYAVEKWHYSRRLPMPPLVRVGVWEDGKFIGCVLFARGANNALGHEYRLSCVEVAELVRVALTQHLTPVSRILSIAVRMVARKEKGLRLLCSYADREQGHYGGIYQASGWLYVGIGQGSTEYFYQGRWQHNREITSGAFGSPRKLRDYATLLKRKTLGKHKYLYPLDAAMRVQLLPLAKPYPKRAASILADAPAVHAGESGAAPTAALCVSK